MLHAAALLTAAIAGRPEAGPAPGTPEPRWLLTQRAAQQRGNAPLGHIFFANNQQLPLAAARPKPKGV